MPHRMLVIDDSLTIRKLVELSFRDGGWTVDFASSGAEGVAKATSLVPDVILLDFVLTDMKATEVCQRLVASGRAGQIPVVLMSAKMEAVRELFKPYPMVVDFVGKPFTTVEIAQRVAHALTRRASAAQPTAPAAQPVVSQPTAVQRTASVLSFKQKEAAANAIFARMRREFASIPEWIRQLGTAPPAPFFARKILTPEVVEGLIEGLTPIIKEILGSQSGLRMSTAPDSGEPSLQGQITAWPLHDLLCVLNASSRTGELWVLYGAQTVITYWQSGEILLVTSQDPTDYVREGLPVLEGLPAQELEQAESEQRSGGKPLYITLAERGVLTDSCDVAALVEQQGRRVLHDALAARSARFFWRERAALPGYVEAYGRHLELAAEPEGTGSVRSHTMVQLTLERLRRPSTWREAEVHLPGSEAIYDRAPGFSSRLAQLRLTANEQRVLTLIDGRTTLSGISERCGIVSKEVARILYRLAQVELIVAPLVRPSSRGSRNNLAPRPVMILEPDREGFHLPLRSLLQSRAEPLELVDLAGEPDLLDAIKRERPALVILNESATDADVGDVARAIRATPQLSNVSLAAVLESRAKMRMDDLAAAGFDAVLVKPVHYLDLNQLIASSFMALQSVPRARETQNHG